MRIERAEILRVGADLDQGPESALGQWRRRSGALLRLWTDEGSVGHGEASPLPGFSPDQLADVIDVLSGLRFDDVPAEPPASLEPATRFARQHVPPSLPSARFAVETALADLVAQRHGRPLWRLLDADPVAPRALSAVVTTLDVSVAVREVGALRERGYATFKIKVGRAGAFDAELRVLRALRERFGDVELRADANGAFTAIELGPRVDALASVGVTLIEEPAPPDVLAGAGRLPVAIAQDESLVDGLDPRTPYAAVVLKPTVLGGLGACVELARLAERAGRDVLVSHTFDGPVALTAAAHLALAISTAGRAQGLAPHAALAAYPAMKLPLHADARVEPRSVLGLGMEAAS